MKVEQVKEFKPVVITLENEIELMILNILVGSKSIVDIVGMAGVTKEQAEDFLRLYSKLNKL